MHPTMRRNLNIVLNYFGYFSYAPSITEIHTFFPKKVSRKNLQSYLTSEVKNKKILRLPNDRSFRAFQSFFNNNSHVTNHFRYTLPQYSTKIISNNDEWSSIAIHIYIFLLGVCPLVRFVGVTGKSAMRGLQKNDDLDLCVITKQNLLWTTRFLVLMFAKILGIHTKKGVCHNLFFDEQDLSTPYKKQNLYIAHEILQMKLLIDKGCTYYRFLNKNKWLHRYFPNTTFLNSKYTNENLKVGNLKIEKMIERFFKSIQLPIIVRNRTALLITPTQLWLFKNDFEKKLKRVGLVI
jgi:hypothetical protein